MPTGRHSETLLEYCDKTDIENYLLLDIDSSFDSQVNTWIAAAESYVNNYLGYTTTSGVLRESITDEQSENAFIDTEGGLMVFPDKTPIVSISALELIKGTQVLNLSLETTEGTQRYNIPTSGDYLIYPGRELSLTGSSIINSFWDISRTKFMTKIDYIAGFSAVPSPIRQATVNIASDFIMRHSNKDGLSSITQGRISKRWFQRKSGESDFIKDAKELLNPFRQSQRWV